MRAVLLVAALALVRAKWVLVYWPNFDVSVPGCKVDGVTSLELSYPELSCGSLSQTCYPSPCINACKNDANCVNIVVKENQRTCQFRCKDDESTHDDFESTMYQRLGYTTFELTNNDEQEMDAMDIVGWNMRASILNTPPPPSPAAIVMIAFAIIGFAASAAILLCIGVCTVCEPVQSYVEKLRIMFGFATPIAPSLAPALAQYTTSPRNPSPRPRAHRCEAPSLTCPHTYSQEASSVASVLLRHLVPTPRLGSGFPRGCCTGGAVVKCRRSCLRVGKRSHTRVRSCGSARKTNLYLYRAKL